MALSQTPSSLPLTNVFFSMPTQPAKSTEFLEVNKNCLKSLILKHKAFIREKNPDLKGQCSDLIKWWKDTAKELRCSRNSLEQARWKPWIGKRYAFYPHFNVLMNVNMSRLSGTFSLTTTTTHILPKFDKLPCSMPLIQHRPKADCPY